MATFKGLPESDRVLCEFNSAGVRKGSCTLPKEIVYVNNCATAGTSSKPVNFLSSKRQGAVEQIDGQYYTCENDVTVPTRVFQYVAGSLREVNAEPNQAWADLLATIPSISDCAVYPGYSTGVKRSHEKRAIVASMNVEGAKQTVAFSTMKLACLTVCSLNGVEILASGRCHNANQPFGNSMKSDGTTFNPTCLRELMVSCSPLTSPYKQNLCGKGRVCSDTERRDFYNNNCASIYRDFADKPTNIQPLLQKCIPWLSTANGKDCTDQLTLLVGESYAYTGRGSNDKNAWAEMQAFLITVEGSPPQ